MKKATLLFFLLMNLNATLAYGRAPAVDNFVGIEPVDMKTRAPSSEKPFNFEKGSSHNVEAAKGFQAPNKAQATLGFWGYMLFTLILGAPFMLWGMVMKKLDHTEEATNVVKFEAKKEDFKKAS